MNCRTESIFYYVQLGGLQVENHCFKWMCWLIQINFINKKLVWDGYLIALRYRLFIQSYIHVHNSFDLIFFK